MASLWSKIPRCSAAHQVAQLGGLLGSLERETGKMGGTWIIATCLFLVTNHDTITKRTYSALSVNQKMALKVK